MRKPFILEFSVARDHEGVPEFQYDEASNLNVILRGNERVPFVDSDINILELATKTEVKREEDEPNVEILEYQSNTRKNIQYNKRGISSFMELLTKTKIQREGDDE